MSHRFGRGWTDADRLNLLTVCYEKTDWKQRHVDMLGLYQKRGSQMFGVSESAMRDELERILQLPTPNLRVDPKKHYSFSRKLMIKKWLDHFEAEAMKESNLAREMARVTIRKNSEIISKVLSQGSKKIGEAEMQKLMEMANMVAEKHKHDVAFQRTVGSVQMVINEKLRENKGTLPLKNMIIPPTKQADEPTGSTSKGFLTPEHKPFRADPFASPPPARRPMLTLEEAVAEAAPIPPPPPPKFVSPQPPTYSSPVKNLMDAMPDDILEMPPAPVDAPADAPADELAEVPPADEKPEKPVETPTEKPDEKPEEKPAAERPASTPPPQPQPQPVSPQKSTPKKKKEATPPLEVKTEEPAKEDEEATSSTMSPSPETFTTKVRSRGRPRIDRRPIIARLAEGKREARRAKQESSPPPSPEATPTPVTPTVSSAKRRVQESVQEEPTTSAKKTRHSIIPTPTMSTRRKKEEVEESTPTTRAPKSETPASRKPEDRQKETPGVQCQTDITIRPIIEVSTVGERYRSGLATHKKKTKRKEDEEELAPPPSTEQPTYRTCMTQTNQYFDLSPKDVVVMRIEVDKRDFHRLNELSVSTNIVVNEETCKEIDAENAANDTSVGGKRAAAAKVDGKKEIQFIVESEECITQRLVEEKGYLLVSQNTDLPTTNESPQKRPRRDEKAREELSAMKALLLKLHRDLHDNEWSEAFKRPVPPGEDAYEMGVKQKIDLSGIKKEIEQGLITNVPLFLLRAYRMLSNAIMFNGYDHDVHIYAKEMAETIMLDVGAEAVERTSNLATASSSTPQSTRRNRPAESREPASRPASLAPEPAASLGVVGEKRAIFRKDANHDMPMTTEGCRKSRKSNR